MLQESCDACGHSFSFHQKQSGKPCRAIGCHAPPKGWVCTGFVMKADASEELQAALSTKV